MGRSSTDLLAIIFLRLGTRTHVDLVRFRSVCRQWRLSISPPPYKLSPFFPLTLRHFYIRYQNLTINASAVYLLRNRRDPRRSWMVHVQESVTGKLVLRHALTYDKIDHDLSWDEWLVTQVARSYTMVCERWSTIQKITCVTRNFGSCQQSGSAIKLAGLCTINGCFNPFELTLGGKAHDHRFNLLPQLFINDFVRFKGRVYVVDEKGVLYVVLFDSNEARPQKITINEIPGKYHPDSRMWLVVSDGDLYLVWSLCHLCGDGFCIYRLLVTRDDGDGMIERGEWTSVEDLGERVFFLNTNCSYSVLARDLPHPWKGNCIVVRGRDYCFGDPKGKEIDVFFVGGTSPRLRSLWSLQGYSDSFDPPSS